MTLSNTKDDCKDDEALLRAIFDGAAEIACPKKRQAFIDKQCGDNASLKSRANRLIHSLSKPDNFLESPFDPLDYGLSRKLVEIDGSDQAANQAAFNTPEIGDKLGEYRLEKIIGEGGFGIVYQARHSELKRAVAIKLIKPGIDNGDVISRFYRERIALSLMNHSGIARIYDVGTTLGNTPYFVMELVDGEPITEYCVKQNLSVNQRIELFLQVCDAVQHAHMKGVIHRDLKPGNVLVSDDNGKPIPTIIDFGIAKATEVTLKNPVHTARLQLVGTPRYMSPEQASFRNDEVDFRSDVYSLGVLLYEMITTTTPAASLNASEDRFDEILERTRNGQIIGLRQRVRHLKTTPNRLTKARGISWKKLQQSIGEDLDCVVGKSLATLQEHRYDSVKEFALDVRRYLNDQPVEARPPSRIYRLKKFVVANKIAVAAALIAFVVLTFTTAASISSANHAYENERLAKVAQRETDAALASVQSKVEIIQSFNAFLSELFLAAQPGGDRQQVSLNDRLLSIAEEVEDKFNDDPVGQSKLLGDIGNLLRHVGNATTASELLERAYQIGPPVEDSNTPSRISLMNKISDDHRNHGRLIEAAKISDETIAKLPKTTNDPSLIEQRLETQRIRAALFIKEEKFQAAIELIQDSQALSKKSLGAGNKHELNLGVDLANVYLNLRRSKDAKQLLERLQPLVRDSFGEQDPVYIKLLMTLSNAYCELNQPDKAIETVEIAVQASQDTFSPQSWVYVCHLLTKAQIELRTGHINKCLETCLLAKKLQRNIENTDPTTLVNLYRTLAIVHGELGNKSAANRSLQQAFKIVDQRLPFDSSLGLDISRRIAILKSSDDRTNSVKELQKLVTTASQKYGADNPRVVGFYKTLGNVLAQSGQYVTAKENLQHALDIQLKHQSHAHPHVIDTVALIADVLKKENDRAGCRLLLKQHYRPADDWRELARSPLEVRLEKTMREFDLWANEDDVQRVTDLFNQIRRLPFFVSSDLHNANE